MCVGVLCSPARVNISSQLRCEGWQLWTSSWPLRHFCGSDFREPGPPLFGFRDTQGNIKQHLYWVMNISYNISLLLELFNVLVPVWSIIQMWMKSKNLSLSIILKTSIGFSFIFQWRRKISRQHRKWKKRNLSQKDFSLNLF